MSHCLIFLYLSQVYAVLLSVLPASLRFIDATPSLFLSLPCSSDIFLSLGPICSLPFQREDLARRSYSLDYRKRVMISVFNRDRVDRVTATLISERRVRKCRSR